MVGASDLLGHRGSALHFIDVGLALGVACSVTSSTFMFMGNASCYMVVSQNKWNPSIDPKIF